MSNTTMVIAAAVLTVAIVATASGVLAYLAARRVDPEAMRHYEHALADMQQRLERTEQRSDRQQEQIDRLRDTLADEQDYLRLVVRAMRDKGLEPPPRPEPRTLPPQSDLAGLSRRVAACFSLEELEVLALELQVDDALTGESLENRAASLVHAALRRGKLSELVAIARRDRPRGGF